MREAFGDMWSYLGRKGFIICITTNGFIKKNGEGVMGAGCAKQAAERFPNLPRLLGISLKVRGNVLSLLTNEILAFPVKHVWNEPARLRLVSQSAHQLAERARTTPEIKYILPRPGCGNGRLRWSKVKNVLEKHIGDLDNVIVIAQEWEAEN